MREFSGGPWSLLWRGVRRNKRQFVGFMCLLTVWHLCETLVPVMIGVVIDRAVATGDWGALVWAISGLVLLFCLLSFGFRFGARLGFGVVQHEMHRIRLEIADRALAPRGTDTRLLPGEVLSLATADTENVGLALRSLGYTVSSFGSLALSAWVLLRIDLGLGLAVLLGVPVVVLVIQLATPAIARRT
ncbi:MAG: ABC transporter ATP-binding protein, partial [Nocardioidaceae bacterium]|nr:ABC transporter ATP-binding protein [Nocardioidaceae bacterium]